MLIDDMNLFVEVVNAKGFTSASRKLHIPTSTISVRINKLEKQLGLQLLNRTTRRIELTDIGKIYYDRAVHIVQESKALHQQLNGILTNPTGILRISIPVDFAYDILSPLLPEFHQRYPLIQLAFDITPRKVDIITETFDMVIRMGEQKNSSLISRKLVTLTRSLYASAHYLAHSGIPNTPEELIHHQCLQLHHQSQWHLIHHSKKEKMIEIQGSFEGNSVGMNLRLACEGLGITILPDILAQQYVQAGKIQRILPTWHAKPITAYILTTTKLLPAKTQVFINFLKEKLATIPY
ncbi:LysR family transcriptional regulator [Pelistega ratti]|uniref:LysR family transcriptional regulator n=1 Tax=Pelistega ratti TaxID=2652177 RepID=UPI001FAA6389|nr:LysR family transcriptional regulator [Pelistega ratti]